MKAKFFLNPSLPLGLVTFAAGCLSAFAATLKAPATAVIGEEVLVEYSGEGPDNGRLTLGDPNGQPLRGANPAELSGEETGSVDLLMPDSPGTYTILYYAGDELLTSREIVVTPVTVTLQAARKAAPAQPLPVKWVGPNDEGDELALRDGDGAIVTRKPLEGEGKRGSLSLPMPAEPGIYELVYLSQDDFLGHLPIEITPEVAVTPDTAPPKATLQTPATVAGGYDFEVVWKGPAAWDDRLVLVTSEDPEEVLEYTFLNPATSRAVLSAPVQPGSYQVQYRDAAGLVLVEQTLQVTDPPGDLTEVMVRAQDTLTFAEESSVHVILDASGSMLKGEGDEERIDLAKETLISFMEENVPAGTLFSLRVFGHLEKGSCESELIIPPAPLDVTGMKPLVEEIEAINLAKTPLAASLTKVPQDLAGVSGARTVILLTDGEETCEGDPAAVIRELRSEGTDVRVNIVGYGIEEREVRENFESWAAIGDGRYFDAPEPVELSGALQGAVAVPYAIYSGENLVASGVSGRTRLELAPGEYEVVWTGPTGEVRKGFAVVAGEATEILIP
ncbi:vWA domain-containing protein [Roseibacillus ishigakijimensis]|uniref:VWA domain-containing protein n=1 Tax=Roseibacillus ishigakijimensis TaxID=454146 RepID=A0A934VLY0_9BACT|nr:VWA domain-containing protein [Roseibacillus ishigakijimensis]MBK1833375.1 VWA domain-containing protein [Roseibacillus ishigakijimensis]